MLSKSSCLRFLHRLRLLRLSRMPRMRISVKLTLVYAVLMVVLLFATCAFTAVGIYYTQYHQVERELSFSIFDALHQLRNQFGSVEEHVTETLPVPPHFKKEDGEKYKLKMFVRYPDTYEFYRGNELIGEYYKQVAEDDFTNEEQPKFKEMLATYTSDCSHITNGAAASYYGVSNVGSVIHKCKYENGGDFPEYLVKLLYNAFSNAFGQYEYDLILYVPPTHSGDLVKHLAENFAQKARIPISHGLKKLRETQEQKIFQNKVSKQANISDAFDIDEDVKGKNIILIDDIYDSGATVIEISQMLSKKGAKFVTPLVLAKTVGGQE